MPHHPYLCIENFCRFDSAKGLWSWKPPVWNAGIITKLKYRQIRGTCPGQTCPPQDPEVQGQHDEDADQKSNPETTLLGS